MSNPTILSLLISLIAMGAANFGIQVRINYRLGLLEERTRTLQFRINQLEGSTTS